MEVNTLTRANILERLEIKRSRLMLYLEAEAAILSGQSYEVEGLKLTRANLTHVQNMIADLENEIEKLENALLSQKQKRSRLRVVIPGGYLR